MFTEPMRRRMQELLGYGLALEGLALWKRPRGGSDAGGVGGSEEPRLRMKVGN